jgi:hypothetical protein
LADVHPLNPLEDCRWPAFVDAHPAASAFHTQAWLGALQRTYGYEPVVYTTDSPSAPSLSNGIVLCRVRSWLTGNRLVSVPFADHCQPLVERSDDRAALVATLQATTREQWRYVELRPLEAGFQAADSQAEISASYAWHCLDLRRPPADIFSGFHESTIRRKVRRAERETLRYVEGRTEDLLADFYRLMVLTRRRHGLPPQPLSWFRNLAIGFGDSLNIGLALKGDQPIAAALTLRHQTTLVYKYGCSDATFHSTGAMPFVFWETIKRANAAGLTTFDLGRSDLDNPGLIAFKSRFGARKSLLTYLRLGARSRASASFRSPLPSGVARRMPSYVLIIAGKMLYRHLA